MITDMAFFNPTKCLSPVKSYKHQEQALQLTKSLPHYGFFWEMGCGKSKPILETAIWLFMCGEIDGLLVVSDKGCYEGWARDHVPTFMYSNIQYRCEVYGSNMGSAQARKVEALFAAQDDVLDILCINVEALSVGRGIDVARRFLEAHHSMMVVDESTSIKSHKAKRTRNVIALGKIAEYRRIATGTPVTQSPLDLWSQCEFLSPGILGFKSFTGFKSFFSLMSRVVMGHRTFFQITGYRNLDVLTRTISQFTSRITKAECLDLPPKIYETVYVEHAPEQAQAYREMRDMAVLQVEQGQVTSTLALTLIGKLHQINCGHVRDDSGVTHDIPSNRLSSLISLLEKLPGKVVIWGHYQRDVELIMKMIDQTFAPEFAVDYYGETHPRDRILHLQSFRHNPKCRWFVGTPAAGGKGLNDLVVANTMIYYANYYDLEDRLQSEDRLHRPGQLDKVTIIDMVVPRTVDVKILQALREKRSLASEVLDSRRLLDILD